MLAWLMKAVRMSGLLRMIYFFCHTKIWAIIFVSNRWLADGIQGNRIIEVNHALKKYKQQVKENLTSEQGIYHRKKRPCDVEPVFGNIKNNHHFKRFMLRGKSKVEIEAGLLALAHNLRKKTA